MYVGQAFISRGMDFFPFLKNALSIQTTTTCYFPRINKIFFSKFSTFTTGI